VTGRKGTESSGMRMESCIKVSDDNDDNDGRELR